MVMKATKGHRVAALSRSARTGRVRTVPVAVGPDLATHPALPRPSRTEQLSAKATSMVNKHLDITPRARACAWLMVEFPGLSRRVADGILSAYCDSTESLSDAYDAARTRLLDACSVD